MFGPARILKMIDLVGLEGLLNLRPPDAESLARLEFLSNSNLFSSLCVCIS